MALKEITDLYYKDLGLNFEKFAESETATEINNLTETLLNDHLIANENSLNEYNKTLKNYKGNINITIEKENSSFDFAKKFKDYLINSEFKTKKNMLSFIEGCSNEIGRLIYERTQNFINNYINVDTCHYKALINYYAENNIEIEKLLTENFPERLDYLLNIFSVTKLYLKNNFYNLSIYDSSISDYIANLNTLEGLQIAENLLNEKYFGNFYESVVYPIVRQELYDHYDEEDIKKYIEDSTADIYSEALTGDYNRYIYLLLLKNSISEDLLDSISLTEKNNLLKAFTDSEGNCPIWVNDSFFKELLLNIPDYNPDSEGLLPTLNLSASIYLSGSADSTVMVEFDMNNPQQYNDDIFELAQNIFPIENSIVSFDYTQIFNFFENYCISRNEFIKILKIKTCAQKIANICNSICKLRETIKQIRIKDSKIGTAILIEEMVAEYIYTKFVQKLGITNQGKVPNNLESLKSFIDNLSDETLKTSLEKLYNKEQGAIGIKWEERFTTLKALAKVLDVEIIEYIDTTPSYLNLIPENNIITVNSTYKKQTVSYPPYLNNLGESIYAYNEKGEIQQEYLNENYEDIALTSMWQYRTGDDTEGYVYKIRKNTSYLTLTLNDNNILTAPDGTIYYFPKNSKLLNPAINLSAADWNENKNIFFLKKSPYQAVDKYDRLISYTQYTNLTNNSSNSILMQWKNRKTLLTNNTDHLILEAPGKFIDYTTDLELLYDIPDPYQPNIIEYFLWENSLSGAVSKEQSELYPTKRIFLLVDISTGSAQIVDIKDNTYFRYMESGDIIDKNVNYYSLLSSETFILNETNETLTYNLNKELIETSTGEILNEYETNVERVYATSNKKYIIKTIDASYQKALDGNTPFWDNLSTNSLFEDKTVEEERDIVKFYKKIGLINDTLSNNYKTTSLDGSSETLATDWMLAREKIINQLKAIWIVNAPYRWYDKEKDDLRYLNGEITESQLESLKQMDETYHSYLGSSMAKNDKIQLKNSIINLENWENNTIAIHPCIWYLVEKTYTSYLKLLTISLYGETILDKIYSNARIWGESHTEAEDKDGTFSFTRDTSEAHNIDYWKTYAKSFFPYSTDYEIATNMNTNETITSRFLDFDGPFNYEALKDIIGKVWTEPGSDNDLSIRYINLSKYYIDCEIE